MDDPRAALVVDDDDFEETAGAVAADVEDGIVTLLDRAERLFDGVEHVLVGDAVLAGAGGDLQGCQPIMTTEPVSTYLDAAE